jgi:hypothetical protein
MRQGPNQRRSRGARSNGKRSFSHGPNRSIESNGPSVKLRGTAVQVYDKYLTLARDATTAGDRVAAESFFQHAEHYYRLMSAAAEQQRADAQRRENADAQRREGADGQRREGPDDQRREASGDRNQPRRGNGKDRDASQTPEGAAEPAAKAAGDPEGPPSDETVN